MAYAVLAEWMRLWIAIEQPASSTFFNHPHVVQTVGLINQHRVIWLNILCRLLICSRKIHLNLFPYYQFITWVGPRLQIPEFLNQLSCPKISKIRIVETPLDLKHDMKPNIKLIAPIAM